MTEIAAESAESEGKRLNWRQACELLNCGKRKFYDLVNSGQLQAWRIKGSKRGLYVLENDVRALLLPLDEG